MAFLTSLLDRLWPCRHGTYACPCGAVQFTLQVPGSSYGLVEQTNAICHCHDCVGFVQACSNGSVVLENNGTHMVQFYKSDVTIVRGRQDEETMGYCKVRAQSPLVRFYCNECGTPLGAYFTLGPIMLLYSKFIWGTNMPLYLPHLVVNYASSFPSNNSTMTTTTRPYDRRVTVRSGIFAPIFLITAISRILLGLIMQKGSTAGFSSVVVNNSSSIPVGLHTIVTKKTKSN